MTADADHYVFSPRLLRPYDLLKKSEQMQNDFDRFISKLDPRFTTVAKSEMYRSGKGWIDKAISAEEIRLFTIDGAQYLVPRIPKSVTIGIDTSSIGTKRLIGIFVIPDAHAVAIYFEKHLRLPKTHNHAEWKWSQLDKEYRKTILENFNFVLRLCCKAALLIETNVLSTGKAHAKDKIKNLVEGCFSGYETSDGTKRKHLRSLFYSLINNTPVHCDSDFDPVSPDDVVRTLVRELAKTDSQFSEYTPMNVPLRSHESITIQVADILVGALKDIKASGSPIQPFEILVFDNRKIRSWHGSFAKAAYFVAEDVMGQAQSTV